MDTEDSVSEEVRGCGRMSDVRVRCEANCPEPGFVYPVIQLILRGQGTGCDITDLSCAPAAPCAGRCGDDDLAWPRLPAAPEQASV